MSDWDSSSPFPDPLVGEKQSDINIEDIERNSPVVISPTQEQQQMVTPSRSTNKNEGGGGQAKKIVFKSCSP